MPRAVQDAGVENAGSKARALPENPKRRGNMRRTLVSLAVVATMSVLVCGVALAALPEIVGTARDDTIRGTEKAELIKALAGKDHVNGGGGADVVKGGKGTDTIVVSRDISEDRVSCGKGDNDTVVAARNDRVDGLPARKAAAVEVTCENVRVVVTPPKPSS
jgi:Ca2+-binding RTX toxin-like protein